MPYYEDPNFWESEWDDSEDPDFTEEEIEDIFDESQYLTSEETAEFLSMFENEDFSQEDLDAFVRNYLGDVEDHSKMELDMSITYLSTEEMDEILKVVFYPYFPFTTFSRN